MFLFILVYFALHFVHLLKIMMTEKLIERTFGNRNIVIMTREK